MKIKLLVPLMFMSVLQFSETFAQINNRYFLNPGIKLGYTFGDHGGFTYGLEISYVQISGYNLAGLSVGPVFNIDFFDGMTRIHLGVEGTLGQTAAGAGLFAGPTLILKDGKKD